MRETYHLCGRFWIVGPDGIFLGPGRVALLERIREHGSISAAARSMEMSYRHAWRLVDKMNHRGPHPVVQKTTGGTHGGGAIVTEAGQRAIDCFKAARRDFEGFLQERSKSLDL